MRKILSITAITLLFTLYSCNKEQYQTMKVVKDCSGTYLQIDGKDFHVCNEEKLSSFSVSTNVNVSFKKIETCTNFKDTFRCKLLHVNEGWVEVVDIK